MSILNFRAKVESRNAWRSLALAGFMLIALTVAACGGGSKEEPPARAPAVPTPTVAVVETSGTSQSVLEALSVPELPESLFLEIIEPQDELIVSDPMVPVVGRTTPDAVVSVNEASVEVDAQGNFVEVVTLEPGPNLIEVGASDLTGDQVSEMLAVIYIP